MSIHIDATANEIAENVLLPGDPLRAKYIAENFLQNPILYSDIRNMYGYTGIYNGVPVSIQGTGMGMPSMGIYSWELISQYNVQRLIRVGTAGSFHKDIALKDVVMSIASSTDSNYIHGFDVPGNYAPCASWKLLTIAKSANQALGLNLKAGNTVSCDVFYEPSPDWWQKWAKLNVLAVEMEAAALYINAAYHGVDALAMMTITDHFITGESATTEERTLANNQMIELALKIATS